MRPIGDTSFSSTKKTKIPIRRFLLTSPNLGNSYVGLKALALVELMRAAEILADKKKRSLKK